LGLEKGGLKHLPRLADILKMNHAEAKKLYLVFLQQWKPNYQQSLPIIISSIEKSVSETQDKLEFNLQPFLEIYQYFSQEKNAKILIEDFSNLSHDSMSWLRWEKLASTLNERWETNVKIITFLDKILGKYFPSKMLATWLNLFLDFSKISNYEESFLKGNTWRFLSVKDLQQLHPALVTKYQSLISQLTLWAINNEQIELINPLLNSLQEIWKEAESIDQSLWNYLTTNALLKSPSTLYWLKLASIKLSTRSNLVLPLPKQSLSSQEEKELYELASQMISISDSPDDIDKILELCQGFGLNPMSILSFAKSTACTPGIVSKYRTFSEGGNRDYIPRLVQLLIQMPSNNDNEKQEIKNLLKHFLLKIIKDLLHSNEQQEEVVKMIVEYL
jgi:hypothetical protein